MMHPVIAQDLKQVTRRITREARVFEGKTILMSGGAGFLGRYVIGTIDRLNKVVFHNPCRVICVDNFITGRKHRLFEGMDESYIELMEQDITKPLHIPSRVDYVIHAAGLASPVYYKKYPIETIESAIFGAKNLLELARTKRAKSFLFFSSSEIYGDPDPNFIPTPETYRGNVSSIGPRACYDESKRLGETLCMTYYDVYRTPIKIIRPFNIFGPGMRPDDYRVVPTFLSRALLKKPLPVHDEGNQTRTFCYITDAVVAIIKVLASTSNGEVYNIGNDENEINMMSLAQMVTELFGGRITIQKINYPPSYPKDEPRRRCPDLTKIKSKLGYAPIVDLHTGLARTLRWFAQEFHDQGAKGIRARG